MAKNKDLDINQTNRNPNSPVSEEQLKKIKTKRIAIVTLLSILAAASIVAMILVFVFSNSYPIIYFGRCKHSGNDFGFCFYKKIVIL